MYGIPPDALSDSVRMAIHFFVNLDIFKWLYLVKTSLINLSFLTRTVLIVHNNPELFTEQIAGIVMVYIGKTKRRLHDRKTEHFKALAKNDNTSAIADHVKATGHNIKWDQFDILAKGKTDYHCKIKETLYIQELEPAFNVNVGSEKLMLY